MYNSDEISILNCAFKKSDDNVKQISCHVLFGESCMPECGHGVQNFFFAIREQGLKLFAAAGTGYIMYALP